MRGADLRWLFFVVVMFLCVCGIGIACGAYESTGGDLPPEHTGMLLPFSCTPALAATVLMLVTLALLITPIRPGGSVRPAGYMLQAQDVTERVRDEEIRERAYGQIERNIEQFAVLGDHIRHPLQVIMGMAELIEDDRAEKTRIPEDPGVPPAARELA